MINKISFSICVGLFAVAMTIASCNKDEPKPPTLNFRVDSTHTSADLHCAPGTTVTVGVICDMGTDPMKIVYSEVAYDGANVDSLYTKYTVPENTSHYEVDFTFTTRNQLGTERWTFNVNDKDGRLTEREIRIVCQ